MNPTILQKAFDEYFAHHVGWNRSRRHHGKTVGRQRAVRYRLFPETPSDADLLRLLGNPVPLSTVYGDMNKIRTLAMKLAATGASQDECVSAQYFWPSLTFLVDDSTVASR